MKINKHAILLLVGMSFLLSCQLLKKDKSVLKAQLEQETTTVVEQQHSLLQQSQLRVTDSADSSFELVLWPRGRFSYSVAKGFEGEAEKMQLKGKMIKISGLNLAQTQQQQTQTSESTSARRAENSMATHQAKARTAFKWGWLVPLIIILGVIWWFRKFR